MAPFSMAPGASFIKIGAPEAGPGASPVLPQGARTWLG